jgi:Rod binding domain-containing protein
MTGQPIQFDKRYTNLAKSAPVDPHHAKLVKTAQKWVAQTFYGQMLKQMRNSPFKSKLFDGGRGGEAFNEMLDQHLADHMSRGAGSKLVNSIVRKIEAASAYKKHSLSRASMMSKSRAAAAKPETTPAIKALRGIG